jgi:CheY-like chemotaxis protein
MSRPFPSQHILVVDDEPMVRATLKMLLNFEGHTVELASDGSEALQKLAEQEFDIVFTDLNMPGMRGDELARRMKRENPQQVIAMVTAYPNVLSPSEKKVNPVDFFITKPFALETIAKALKQAHEINQANRKNAEL